MSCCWSIKKISKSKNIKKNNRFCKKIGCWYTDTEIFTDKNAQGNRKRNKLQRCLDHQLFVNIKKALCLKLYVIHTLFKWYACNFHVQWKMCLETKSEKKIPTIQNFSTLSFWRKYLILFTYWSWLEMAEMEFSMVFWIIEVIWNFNGF